MAQHGLYVPINAPWYSSFRSELMSFPTGKHDDQADMLGLLGQLLNRMQTGSKPRQLVTRACDAWDKAFGANDMMKLTGRRRDQATSYYRTHGSPSFALGDYSSQATGNALVILRTRIRGRHWDESPTSADAALQRGLGKRNHPGDFPGF